MARRLTSRAARDVLIEEGRRNFQNVRDVVETIADVVAGKQRRGVHFHAENVLHLVRVFGAIQPVQRNGSRIGRRERGLIERRFQKMSRTN